MRWSIQHHYSQHVDIPHSVHTSVEGTGVLDVRLALSSLSLSLQDLRHDEENHGEDCRDDREDHEETEAVDQALETTTFRETFSKRWHFSVVSCFIHD